MQFLANLPPPAIQMKRAERERMTALHVAAYRCRLAPMWHKPEPQLGGVYLLRLSPYSPAIPVLLALDGVCLGYRLAGKR